MILIAIVTTFSVFILATFLGSCVPAINSGEEESTQEYFCPSKGLSTHVGSFYFFEYFNDMATLVFNSEEDAIKQLFHHHGKSIYKWTDESKSLAHKLICSSRKKKQNLKLFVKLKKLIDIGESVTHKLTYTIVLPTIFSDNYGCFPSL